MSEEAEDAAQTAAMEEVKHLTEKLSHLQKEIYSRQNSLSVMQKAIDEAVAIPDIEEERALISAREVNISIKTMMQEYMAKSMEELNDRVRSLDGEPQLSFAVTFKNGKHEIRVRVGESTKFGDLLKEVKQLWGVPLSTPFCFRDETGNYWSPLNRVVEAFSALPQKPSLYFLHRKKPDIDALMAFDPDKLLKSAAAKYNRNAMIKNQGRSRFLIVDALKITFFTAFFVVTLLLGQNIMDTHKFLNSIKEEFIYMNSGFSNNGVAVKDQDTQGFHSIRTSTEIFKYMRGAFKNTLFPRSTLVNSTDPPPAGVINEDIYVIHSIRMRQIRTYTDSCALAPAAGITVHVGSCYADYAEDSLYPGVKKRNGDSFGTGTTECSGSNNTAFDVQSYMKPTLVFPEDAKEIERFPRLARVTGKYYDYLPEGFVATLPVEETEFLKKLDQLEHCRWFDQSTRVIFVEVNFYTPYIDQFAAMKLVFEFTPSGAIIPTHKILAAKTTIFSSERDIPVLLMRIVVLIVCFSRFFSWRDEIYALIGQYGSWNGFFNMFTLMDVTVVALVIQTSWRRIWLHLDWKAGFLYRNLDTQEYFEIYGMLQELHLVGVLESWAVLLSFFILIKYCDIVAEGSLIVDTFRVAAPSIIAFFFFFGALLLGFTYLYHNIYGSYMGTFSDAGSSTRAMLLALIGDVTFQEAFTLPWETEFLHDVLFFAYLTSMYYFMASIFIAIMNEAHCEVQRTYAKEKDKRQFVSKQIAFDVLFSWALPLQERISRGRAEEAEQEKAKLEMQSIVVDRDLIK